MRKIPLEQLINKKFNKLTILQESFKKNKRRFFLCKCDCGNQTTLVLSRITNGYTKSCGKCKNKKHGFSRTRIYSIWAGIKRRCLNKNCGIFYKYGGRGIKVCDEWLRFENFKEWSDKNGYNDKLTIDRINSNGDYEPSNCRWATYQQQNSNLSMLKNNKSGYKGVSWSKRENKWVCVISINNKSKRIGSFSDIKEAVKARNDFIDKNNLIYHQKNEI
jgi:hypothetical protein